MSNFKMDDYIDVAERLVDFHTRYPEGTCQTVSWSVEDVAGKTFIVYHAAAYRTPDDQRPGQGIAWEPFPGQTNFTKNSELMNAETAAWGRAIVACGLTAKRALASRQEVAPRVAEQEAEATVSRSKPAKSTTRGKAQDNLAEAPTGPQDGSGEVVSDTTLAELAKLAKQAFPQQADRTREMRKMMDEAGAEGRKSDQLTQDEASWIVLALREKVKA